MNHSQYLTWLSWGTIYCRVALISSRTSAYWSVSFGMAFSCWGTGISELAWVQTEWLVTRFCINTIQVWFTWTWSLGCSRNFYMAGINKWVGLHISSTLTLPTVNSTPLCTNATDVSEHLQSKARYTMLKIHLYIAEHLSPSILFITPR